MKLRKNEYVPIHHSRFYCCREHTERERRLGLGVQRIEDPHHPRGYREIRLSAEMRKLLNREIVEQSGKCAICQKEFIDCNDIVPDHKDCSDILRMIISSSSSHSFRMIGFAIQKKDLAGLDG